MDDAFGANLKAASYVCPICDGMLHATSEHALIAPEGDVSSDAMPTSNELPAARKRGELVTEDEWRARTKRSCCHVFSLSGYKTGLRPPADEGPTVAADQRPQE